MTKPIRIRLYGVVSVTKRGYITQLVVASVLLVVLLMLRLNLPALPIGLRPQDVGTGGAIALWLLVNLHWIVLGLALLFTVEAFFVLRRFARLARQQTGERGSRVEDRG